MKQTYKAKQRSKRPVAAEIDAAPQADSQASQVSNEAEETLGDIDDLLDDVLEDVIPEPPQKLESKEEARAYLSEFSSRPGSTWPGYLDEKDRLKLLYPEWFKCGC